MDPQVPLTHGLELPEPSRVRWHKNGLIGPMRRGALISGVIGTVMLLFASSSMATGEITIFTFVLIFLMFYFADNAMGRFIMSQRAPREFGLWPGGVIVRGARREDAFQWAELEEVVVAPVAGRFSVLQFRTTQGTAKSFTAVPPQLASEVKLSWLEAQARRARRSASMPVARTVEARGAKPGAPAPALLEVSRAPAFWKPGTTGVQGPPEPPAPAVEAGYALDASRRALGVQAPPPPLVPPMAEAPVPALPAAPRPEWSFTRIGAGEPTPDPRYPVQQGSVESFRWHFIPTAGSQTGAWLLMAVVVLASIVISRITADLALSLLGMASDPWTATGVGLAGGLFMALVFYRLARGEISGEVAGSVIFLPMFDRTKSDIAATLREAGVSLEVGEARVKERRGRVTFTWTQARTRAVVMQASHESRAILLRTVGRGRFDLHQRFKGAILERLQAGRAIRPPQLRK